MWLPRSSARSRLTDSPLRQCSCRRCMSLISRRGGRSEEHTSELQSPCNLVCRPLLEKKEEHKMTVQQVRAEIEPEGFRFETSLETLPRQHILIFRPYAKDHDQARD